MLSILKQWRAIILAVLLAGPVIAYVGFGTIWLWERGWLWIAALLWIAAGTAFSILAARWTRNIHPIIPPIDWASPGTFSPRDREAWKLIEAEADAGNALDMETLLGPELYGQTGRHLLRRLAEFYHPNTSHPLDDVPLLDLLTAIELAADDLGQLSRQVPGGDMITLSHWRRAVQVAGYISKANDIYSILSPILNPLSGLARLGTRELIVKPAWRDMQQNVLRWFYQAYVNRLGFHLIELMSGRLAIGAEQYRRLTRRKPLPAVSGSLEDKPLVAAIVGSRGSGKSRLIETMKQALAGEVSLIMARFTGLGLAPSLVERLRSVHWIEVPGYAPSGDPESRRDRSLRQSALETAIDCDLLILVVNARNGLQPADVALAQAWDRHFLENPQRDAPPTLVVITGADHPDFGAIWSPPYDWSAGKGVRESAIRALFDSLRATLPPTFNTFTATGLSVETPFGVAEHLVPALVAQLHRSERAALVRQLQALSGRSKVGRVMSQLGQQGRQIWSHLRRRRTSAARIE
jgi:predicted GTPase